MYSFMGMNMYDFLVFAVVYKIDHRLIKLFINCFFFFVKSCSLIGMHVGSL
jgi:hypothetical protein